MQQQLHLHRTLASSSCSRLCKRQDNPYRVVICCAACRKIHKPRILLLDCPLEYKKGENQTNVELSREEDWCALKLQGCGELIEHSYSCGAAPARCLPGLDACRKLHKLVL